MPGDEARLNWVSDDLNIDSLFLTFMFTGFQLSASRFFIYFLFVVMTNISAVSIAFGISAGTRVVGIANLFIAIIFVVSMVSEFCACFL